MGLPVGSNLQKPCVGARRPRRLPWQCSEQCCEDALWWQMQTLARREEVNTPPRHRNGAEAQWGLLFTSQRDLVSTDHRPTW